MLANILPLFLIAQKPKGVGSGGFIPQSKLDSLKRLQDQTTDTLTVDTTIYKYLYINDIFHKIDFADTLANIAFLHKFGLSNQGEYVNTGNYGSAVQSIIYHPEVNIGFSHGYNQYRYYQIRPENFRFYEQNRPLADVF
ncbi:MAG: putative porin, partial [Saprospiraceae bacterium]